MNVLLDTHAMLWFAAGDNRLSPATRRVIEDPANTCYISMASWWEIAIKCSLDRLQLTKPLSSFLADRVDEGFRVLDIEMTHLLPLTQLPFHHRDPFDRLIVCQAMAEDMPICSADENFAAYDVKLIW